MTRRKIRLAKRKMAHKLPKNTHTQQFPTAMQYTPREENILRWKYNNLYFMRIHGGYFVCLFSLSVFLCVSVAFFFWFGFVSIEIVDFGNVFKFHCCVPRRLSLSLYLSVCHFQSRWSPLILARAHMRKNLSTEETRFVGFFVTLLRYTKCLCVCVCVLDDKLWHIIISLETYKRQRKRRKTNLNHSKFARMLIFLSFLLALNLWTKIGHKNEINTAHTHNESNVSEFRSSLFKCDKLRKSSGRGTQRVAGGGDGCKVEQKYTRDMNNNDNNKNNKENFSQQRAGIKCTHIHSIWNDIAYRML